MNESIILYDNRKRFKFIALAIFCILFSLAFIYFMLFINRRISLYVTFGMLGVSILILNSEGCDFKDSPIGKVKWSNVDSLDIKKIAGTKYILLKLIKPERFVNNIPKAF